MFNFLCAMTLRQPLAACREQIPQEGQPAVLVGLHRLSGLTLRYDKTPTAHVLSKTRLRVLWDS
jgi:hypothetical protein